MRNRRYANDTKVPASQSRNEIEALLKRYGADQTLFGTMTGAALIGFRIKGLQIKIKLRLPTTDDAKAQREARRLWRALVLVLKAKLEAVASGIAVLEDEFMAYTVMPDGTTLGDWARPQIASMYKSGKMPDSILSLPPPRED
jgi:hypothetical protein